MKMRWEWRWDESYLTRTRRGERKRRGKEQPHTNTPSPERANPEKAREKKKAEADGHGPRPAEGGEDGSAWTNLTKRKPTKTSARDGPDLPEEERKHEIGDQWGTSWWKHRKTENRTQLLKTRGRALLPSGNVVRSRPKALNSCTSSNELDAQYVWPHQKPKRPHLQEKDMPVAFCRSCHVSPQKLKLQRKRGFWWFRPLSLW